jgi:hypothetical protein
MGAPSVPPEGSPIQLGYDPVWLLQPPEPPAPPAGDGSAGTVLPLDTWSGVLDVYVEPGLLWQIQPAMDTYVADLTREGYTVMVQEFAGSAAELRAQLQARYAAANIEGALFVGDLPVLMFQNPGDLYTTGAFVHDLYFQDLDGTYVMSDTAPDQHTAGTGDILPEIYVSRITTSTVTSLTGRSEADLINRYFAKVHAYRMGTLTYQNRGILWSDDDWQFTSYYMGGTSLYSEILNVRDPAQTTRQSYVDCLGMDYESMMDMIHSGPTGHAITGVGGGGVTSAQIVQINPRQAFYNLWNCSSADFTVNANLIGAYVYGGDYGLNAVGSTKTGSMLASNYYYQFQGEGDSLGQAFERWWTAAGIDGTTLSSWHYGMVMQGDPTLRPATMGDARLLAAAGADRQVNLGRQVTLDGTGTRNPEGLELAWQWQQIAGPQVQLAGADQPVATFTPTQAGGYTFRLTVRAGELASSDDVNVTVVVAAPTGVDLQAGSDTGQDHADNLTRLNNSGSAGKMTFSVSGTIAGAWVVLYADGLLAGYATADSDTTVITTFGDLPLGDGPHVFTARQSEPSQSESAASPALTVTVDTVGPTISSAYTRDATDVVVVFAEPVASAGATTPGNYRFEVGPAVLAATMDDTRTVCLALESPLAEGTQYTLRVSGLADLAGNPLAAGTRVTVRVADPSMLMWWTFDEGAGTIARDYSGHGRDGAVMGATWDAAGRIGTALRFDGVNDYVVDEDAENYLNGLPAITVTMWVKTDVIPNERGMLTTRDPSESHPEEADWSKNCLSIRYNDAADHSIQVPKPTQCIKAYVQTTIDKSILEGPDRSYTFNWQHVAITWAADTSIRLYLDGRPAALSYDEGTLGGAVANATTLILGEAYKTPNGAWKGLIDDVRIYGRRLNDAEIAAVANQAPVAIDEAYPLRQDGSLVVAAPAGVLANDTDPDHGPAALGVNAASIGLPAHGQLQLHADGSFLYTPMPGYWGQDSFTYRATDGCEDSNRAVVSLTIQPTPTVTGRYVFYDNSTFDDPANGVGDDDAIAPDKQALLPGQAAGFANYTSYARGLNGIMLDVFALPADALSVQDFTFRVGNSNQLGAWADAPLPTITLRKGGGANGTDRVSLVWPDNAIRGQWLQVTLRADANTQLPADDVFYFGNAPCEVGNSSGDANVNVLDISAVRSRQTTYVNPATITNAYDFDRDGRVNVLDISAARASQTTYVNTLMLLSAPAAPAAAPASPGRPTIAAPPLQTGPLELAAPIIAPSAAVVTATEDSVASLRPATTAWVRSPQPSTPAVRVLPARWQGIRAMRATRPSFAGSLGDSYDLLLSPVLDLQARHPGEFPDIVRYQNPA